MRYVRRRGRTCLHLYPLQRTNEGPHNLPTESSHRAWAPLRGDETSSRAINGRGIVAKKRITPPRSKRLIHATMPVRTIDGTADLVSRETARMRFAHRGETGRSTNDAKPGGIAQWITNYADIQLVTHPAVLTLKDVLYVALRHRTIDRHGIAPGRGQFQDHRPHAQFDTEPTVGVAVAVPPRSPTTVSGSVSRETVLFPASIGIAMSVPCPSQMTDPTANCCAGSSPPTTPVVSDATKAISVSGSITLRNAGASNTGSVPTVVCTASTRGSRFLNHD